MITVDKFVEKIEKEMRSGLISILLLSAIERSGPIHGYGIIKAVHEASGGTFSFKEGTIYPLLAEMEQTGLVKSFWGSGASGPQRKYYEICADGKVALERLKESWNSMQETTGLIIGGTKNIEMEEVIECKTVMRKQK
ncbi:MAG: helix-turn-helix transcriptional regulator [Candidatus Thermoplasmatota archaeon]|nr:helix-turn-helix transcriptional regulator [Candidatus Thermoplasmatota archaeon]